MAKKKHNSWAIPFPMHNAPDPKAPKKSIFDELLEYGDADNMLVIGTAYGNGNIIKQALDKGANVNSSNGIALRYAAEAGMTDLVKDLLQRGADPKADDSAAFRWACAKGYLPIVEILHRAGADIHTIADCGLAWAMAAKKAKVVAYLKANKCEVDDDNPFREEQENLKKDEVHEKKVRMAMRYKPQPEDDDDDPAVKSSLGQALNQAINAPVASPAPGKVTGGSTGQLTP